MKMLFAVVFLVTCLIVAAFACEKNCFPYKGGCACDIEPETATPVKPSDEKPPSDKMPSYQREGVHVIDAPSMSDQDAKFDQEKRDAEAQGKKAAKLNP